jgi:subtilisin family serine protease
VAPRALLGNYNVFPGWVVSARSEDILNALETAYADGMDVANMSLGGGYRGAQELVTHAVNNLDRANMVIAISQGNNGPGYFTGGSPGMAERAITAGASTVGHFVGTPVTVAGEGTWGAAAGDFNKVTANLTAPLGVVKDAAATSTGGLGTACAALPAGSLKGKIALISRGACDFSTKIYYAQAAGAVAALVVNNVAGDPTSMGQGVSPSGVQPIIPAYMLPLSARAALLDANGKSTTIDKDLEYFNTANDNIMAGFSAWGPTRVTYRIKPDLVAPGVNVLSSVAYREEMTAPGEPGADRNCGATGCFAFFQGTSMASPHVAGAAAVCARSIPPGQPGRCARH